MTQALNDKITVTRLSKSGLCKTNLLGCLNFISNEGKNHRGISLASLILMPKSIQLYVARKGYEKEQKAS